jgi:hypothetical protein
LCFHFKNYVTRAWVKEIKTPSVEVQAYFILYATIKLRIEWIIATARLLPNLIRCFKCHEFGHKAARCTIKDVAKEVCRKCGSREHGIKDCNNEPKCALCLREKLEILREKFKLQEGRQE